MLHVLVYKLLTVLSFALDLVRVIPGGYGQRQRGHDSRDNQGQRCE